MKKSTKSNDKLVVIHALWVKSVLDN